MFDPITIDSNSPPLYFLDGMLSNLSRLYREPNGWELLALTPSKKARKQPCVSCGGERRGVYGNIPLSCLESNNHLQLYINQIFSFLP